MKNKRSEELVNIGKIGSSVGLRGEVRVNLYSPDSNNLKEGKVLLLKREAAPRGTGAARSRAAGTPNSAAGAAGGAPQELRAACRNVRLQAGKPVIRIEGIEDRSAADSVRGMELYIYAEDLEELPEGQHYVRDIIGYKVFDLASGTEIGELRDVIQNTSQNVLDVAAPDGRQILIPAVDAFMRRFDDENGVIEVELIPGFL